MPQKRQKLRGALRGAQKTVPHKFLDTIRTQGYQGEGPGIEKLGKRY